MPIIVPGLSPGFPVTSPAARPAPGRCGQAAQFAAWLHQDTGRPADADAWFDRALAAAVEVDDRQLVASVLSMRAQHAWARRDPGRTVELARGAQREGQHLTPGVLGLAAQQEARGLALDGAGTAALRKADESERLTDRAADRPEDEPPWIYFDGEPYRLVRRGIVLDHLGRHREAADALTVGIDQLPPSMRRDRARYLPLLAAALATRSTQAGRNLRRARRALDRWSGTPAVAELDERLRAAGLGPAAGPPP
jgi:hypothetical protein